VFEPGYTCEPTEYCPRNPFAFLASADLAGLFAPLSLLTPVFGILVFVAIVRHWRAAGPVGRRALIPVVVAFPFDFLYNSIWYISGSYGIEILRSLIEHPFVNVISWVLPGAFLIGVWRARSASASLPAAIVELGALPTSADLEAVLRRRLGDPELRVVRWSRTQAAFLDGDGRSVEPPGPEAGQRLVVLGRDGEPIGGVVLDAALDDPGLATTLTSLVRLTVDATELRDELRAHGGDVAGLPTGEVTFLFGDIEGSTAILERLGDRYAELLGELRGLVGEVADGSGGRVVDARADEVFLAFPRAADAAVAALEIQRRIGAAAWPDGAAVRLRIGLHTGRPELGPAGYVGLDVHRAARVMATAHGGQVVATMAFVEALGATSDITVRPLGRYALRGLSEPTAIVQLDRDGATAAFPALRAEPAG
jgi:class 3 adenylate cyclase